MSIPFWIIVGMGAGLFGKYMLKDGWRGGIAGDIVVGGMTFIVIGWVIMHLLGSAAMPRMNAASLGCAILGAVAILWSGRIIAARQTQD